jgi:hypothetical protein
MGFDKFDEEVESLVEEMQTRLRRLNVEYQAQMTAAGIK